MNCHESVLYVIYLLQCNSIVTKTVGFKYTRLNSEYYFVLHASVLHMVEDNLLWVVMDWRWSLAAFYSSLRYRSCQKCGTETGQETEVLRV